MVCHDVDDLIMKYMDGGVDESEVVKMREHLSVCCRCAADFKMYDDILAGFSEIKLLCAPIGFEDRVMCRVAELPSLAARLNSTIENMMCLIWGSVSVLFGLGFLMVINRDNIMEYLYSRPELAGYADVLEHWGQYTAGMMMSVNHIIITSAKYASDARYVLLAILAVLAAVQIAVHRRSQMRH